MSPSLLLELRAGFDERLSSLGQRFRHEKTGEEWDAILMTVPPADPTNQELGSDIREKATMEGRRDSIPPMRYGDVVVQVRPFWAERDTDQIRWKLIHRHDNPADFAIKYWLVKVTNVDEQAFF